MMIPPSATLGELREIAGGELRGASPHMTITGVASIAEATSEQITWVASSRFARELPNCRAGAVVISASLGDIGIPAIITPDPELAIARILERFRSPIERPLEGVHSAAIIAATATLGKNTRIGPVVRVGDRSRIGDRCILHAGAHVASDCDVGQDCEIFPHVYIGDGCVLANRVVIKPGAVVGSDGFGFIFRNGAHHRVPHAGIVIVEDDVEIGANSCIDRAKVGATIIGRGTKIDNQVQVAHNCRLGSHCILAGKTGLSGSVRIGNGVVMGGGAGAIHGVNICDGARIAIASIITKDLTCVGDYSGVPARPHVEHNRAIAAMRRSRETVSRVRQLERRIADLEASLHDGQRTTYNPEASP